MKTVTLADLQERIAQINKCYQVVQFEVNYNYIPDSEQCYVTRDSELSFTFHIHNRHIFNVYIIERLLDRFVYLINSFSTPSEKFFKKRLYTFLTVPQYKNFAFLLFVNSEKIQTICTRSISDSRIIRDNNTLYVIINIHHYRHLSHKDLFLALMRLRFRLRDEHRVII